MRDQQSWLPKDRVTVCDVIDTGACIDGVLEHLKQDSRIAGESDATNEWIARAALIDGYGSGSGYGNGDGYGYGSGSMLPPSYA